MKILIITNNPDRASFRQRIAVYVDNLKAAGIDCEIAKLPAGILSRRKLFRGAKYFDAVLLHKKTLNLFDAYYLRKYAKKIIYYFDDAVMFDDKQPQKPHHKRQTSFRRTVLLADLVIAGNVYLAEHAKKFNSTVGIIPTGLDLAAYNVKIPPNNDDKIRLVWIGSRPTLINLKQIAPALEEIGSRFDNVILRIICDDFFDVPKIPVEKHRWSLETQTAELVSSDIGLAPLADNNFTRGKCGFKILQYQAAGLPVVASPVGVNSEIITNGSTGFLASSHRDWVDCLSRLIQNAALRRQMGFNARQSIKSFDSKLIAGRLIKIINRVTS
jgi:glycosyltransferase involved in cell wall biosynthesis